MTGTYQHITTLCDKSIQLGDFGFKREHEWHLKNINSDNHKICFGNHDDYNYLNFKHSIGNYGLFNGVYCIRGGVSLDKDIRVLGRDYFLNEELSTYESNLCIEDYVKTKPDIVVSHDCPKFILYAIHGDRAINTFTSNLLEELFDLHNPKLWIFGHHHKSFKIKINNCTFIGLNECEYYKL